MVAKSTIRMLLSVYLALIVSFNYAISDVIQSINSETGLKGWKLKQGDLELELIQRLPDQTRGFYLARGFSTTVVNNIATSCVLQTIVRNTGSENRGKPIKISLKQWRIEHKNKLLMVKLKEQWNTEWSDTKVSTAARIAFRWSTFPTEQVFNPNGDYNWGMISFNLAPGEVFNLKLKWEISQQTHQATISNIECPKDR